MSTSKLSDELMKVPKLDVGGTNWVIYKDRLTWSIDARGYLHHIDGSEVEPVDPVTRVAGQTLTPTELIADTEWRKELRTWRQEEAVVKQQIAATIPDSLFIKI